MPLNIINSSDGPVCAHLKVSLFMSQ